MRVLTGCLGAVMGAAVGFFALPFGYFLLHPRRGCMDGLAVLPMYPFMFLGLIAGAALGAVAMNRLIAVAVNGLWAWSSRQGGQSSAARGPDDGH